MVFSFLNVLPRIFVILTSFSRNACIAAEPRVQIAFGRIILICLNSSSFVHVSLSFGRGFLLFGGLHFTTFVINTSSLERSIASSTFVKSCPDLPTNGLHSSSSFCPGPSPINMSLAFGFPSPKTIFFLPSDPSGHIRHFLYGAYSSSSKACLYFLISMVLLSLGLCLIDLKCIQKTKLKQLCRSKNESEKIS